MRVAVVSPYSWSHPGGVNNHIEGLSRVLADRGHRVTVVAPDSGRTPPGVAFASAGRSLPVPANGSVARVALAPGTSARTAGLMRSGRFDVVHVHEPLVPFVSTAAVLNSPCRVVGTFHAAGEGRNLLYAAARLMFTRVRGRLDRLVAVSDEARSLASRYFPGDYEIIPNGVDLTRFSPESAAPSRFPDSGPVVLFVGRNEPRKGIGVLLGALPELARSVPGVRLVVAGAGFDEEKLLRRLPGHLRDRVFVAGRVPNEELPGYYAAADVFCAPALGGESFGVVLLESLACGTPVVASDIPGYRAVVERTGGGDTFPAGDEAGLASALQKMLSDGERREALARRGLEGVREFSWEKLAPRLESVYLG